MAILSKCQLTSILYFFSLTASMPTPTTPHLAIRNVPFEWTALGDSYASGVGSGTVDEKRRCMRYSDAYPRAMQAGSSLPDTGSRKLNNVVCSGSSAQDILDHQFKDQGSNETQYGARPAFGKPQMATISLGGNDIGLRYLLNSCIYNFYPSLYTCDEAIAASFAAIDDPILVENISKVISTTLAKGRQGFPDAFKVFVTGYAQFFDATTDQCSDVTWSR